MGKYQKENGTPMIEIFGGLFALLLVLFVIISMVTKIEIMERMEAIKTDGQFKIGWDNDSHGFIVISYPSSLYLIEEEIFISKKDLCKKNSRFYAYASKVYSGKKNNQIIFAILEGGVSTMSEARNCLMRIMPNKKLSIGWIIADNELLKAVSINDIPSYINEVIGDSEIPN